MLRQKCLSSPVLSIILKLKQVQSPPSVLVTIKTILYGVHKYFASGLDKSLYVHTNLISFSFSLLLSFSRL